MYWFEGGPCGQRYPAHALGREDPLLRGLADHLGPLGKRDLHHYVVLSGRGPVERIDAFVSCNERQTPCQGREFQRHEFSLPNGIGRYAYREFLDDRVRSAGDIVGTPGNGGPAGRGHDLLIAAPQFLRGQFSVILEKPGAIHAVVGPPVCHQGITLGVEIDGYMVIGSVPVFAVSDIDRLDLVGGQVEPRLSLVRDCPENRILVGVAEIYRPAGGPDLHEDRAEPLQGGEFDAWPSQRLDGRGREHEHEFGVIADGPEHDTEEHCAVDTVAVPVGERRIGGTDHAQGHL